MKDYFKQLNTLKANEPAMSYIKCAIAPLDKGLASIKEALWLSEQLAKEGVEVDALVIQAVAHNPNL